MSSKHTFHRLAVKTFSFFTVLATALFALAAPNAGAQENSTNATANSSSGLYIVQLLEPPVASYTGGVAGLRATRPASGRKLDRANADVQRYKAYLAGKHDALIASVGGAQKAYSYGYVFNGFAARLTPAQARQLAANPNVLAVTKDEIVTVDTVSTPDFLGLTRPGGLWAQLGGPANAGKGVIVGIIDSGIWPESASFADDGSFSPPGPRWRGACVSGEDWDPTTDCNNKIIGARYYNAGFGGDAGIDATLPFEFNSPRDHNGHGSHTASTAAGNHDVAAEAAGAYLGQASGMAPGAHIAVYKTCWSVPGTAGSCSGVDLVAAIEDATADGVDVINYSISGTRTNYVDPVEFAFMQAAAAGVFVAASAGNSGPGATTVAHISPWLTSVAAGTHDRDYASTVTLGNGVAYSGKSSGSGTPVAPVILASAAGLPGANPDALRLCFTAADNGGTPVLDPARVAGKIVVCDRGVIARINKSLAVKDAGGIGVILVNTSPSSVNADLHFIPTIHTDEVAGAAIKSYVASAGASATAQIAPGVKVVAEAPFVAAFSSRGPSLAGGGDILKPDIMAPGVDVLAAVAPPNNFGRNFDFYSGTSMSSPHVAGLAALLKDRHPGWTPMMIKSALMTSASQTTNAGNPLSAAGNPFGYGAGQVAPNSATDPGLVYNSGASDWIAFLCGQKLLVDPRCPAVAIDASDLNQASIAIGDLAGIQTIKRTVTNVGDKTATYQAAARVPGLDVVVTPARLTLKPGESKSFTVKFTRTTAALNAYTFGSLVWSSNKHTVRSPIAIRPVAIAAPAEVTGSGASGSADLGVTFGYSGTFAALPHGLTPATVDAGTLNQDPDQIFDPADLTGTLSYQVTIPAGAEYARFETLTADTNDPGTDIDLYVYRGSTLVGSSAGGTSDEQVNLTKPVAATYTVYVHGWGVPAGSTPIKLYSWAVTPAAAGNMTVSAPSSASVGATGNVALSWSGLSPATRYLGTITYHNVAAPASYDDGRIGATVVGVNVP